MLHLMDFKLIVRVLILATIVASTIIYYIVQSFTSNYPTYQVVFIASFVSAVLAFVVTVPTVYRRMWQFLRFVNATTLQDLNGVWCGTVQPSKGTSIGVRATIRQSLFVTEIDLHGETVKSVTLAAVPMMEAGQHKMYYVYRAEPKEPNWQPYTGTTRMTLRVMKPGAESPLVMSGQYFTDRGTGGTIELSQTDSDPTKDIAFY